MCKAHIRLIAQGSRLGHYRAAGAKPLGQVYGGLQQESHVHSSPMFRGCAGLTSRPLPSSGEPTPYSLQAQAQLVGHLCGALGLMRVVLVGHSDGAPLALMAAAELSASRPSPPNPPASPSRRGPDNGRCGSPSLTVLVCYCPSSQCNHMEILRS
jgi:hypothetical protein